VTRKVVRELLRRLGAGDPDAIADLYAEEVDWQLDWPEHEVGGEVPWIRARPTRSDVADHFRSIAAHHDTSAAAAEVSRVVVDGADAVVMGEIVNTLRSGARSYRARFALHLTVTGGRIVRHHVYEDSLTVARAWYGR
jgi:ketosteroid isomerase-like protein